MNERETGEVVEGEVVEEEEGAELAVRPEAGMRPINIPEFQAWADSRAEALGILMEMGIAQTKPEDWSDQGGKPYPEQGACSAIVNMVGITISPPARRKENFDDELGRYYIYFLESEVTIPKFGIGPLPIVGRASSRDPFFAWRTRKGEDGEPVYEAGKKVKDLRPSSEIDPGDILSKAYTNLRYRAVKATVPQVANITWEALKELTAGRVAREGVKQVHYGGSEEESPQEGNCPTCHRGTLKEIQRRDGTGSFWACDRGSYDREKKKRVGCPHTQNDPPAAPAKAKEAAPAAAAPPADSKGPEAPSPGGESPAAEDGEDPEAALTAELIRCFSDADGKLHSDVGKAWLMYHYGRDAKVPSVMVPADVKGALEKLDGVDPGGLVGWKRPGDGAKS